MSIQSRLSMEQIIGREREQLIAQILAGYSLECTEESAAEQAIIAYTVTSFLFESYRLHYKM